MTDKSKKCRFCDLKFRYKRKDQKFCSLDCAGSFRSQSRTETRECQSAECSETFMVPISSPKKYCGHSCSATTTNQNRYEKRFCAQRECSVPLSDFGRKYNYCSSKCAKLDEISDWLSGKITANRKYGIAAFARRYVEDQSGGRCEAIDSRTKIRCTEDRVTAKGNTILDLDHIDGDWENNKRENLRMICPNCHRLTATWGAGNMGNGRTYKKNYNQFKSKTRQD